MAIITDKERRARQKYLEDVARDALEHEQRVAAGAQNIIDEVSTKLPQAVDMLIASFREMYTFDGNGMAGLNGTHPLGFYQIDSTARAATQVLDLIVAEVLKRSGPQERYYIRLTWGSEYELYSLLMSSSVLPVVENPARGIFSRGRWTRG